MAEQEQGDNNMVSARSFDYRGELNGEVKAGNGRLVAAFERLPQLEVFKAGKMIGGRRLPFLKLAPGAEFLSPATNDTTFHLSVVTEDSIKLIKVDLRLPAGVRSDMKLSFAVSNFIGPTLLGPFELRFSTPHHKWQERDTLADVYVELDDTSVRYQTYVLHEKLY